MVARTGFGTRFVFNARPPTAGAPGASFDPRQATNGLRGLDHCWASRLANATGSAPIPTFLRSAYIA